MGIEKKDNDFDEANENFFYENNEEGEELTDEEEETAELNPDDDAKIIEIIVICEDCGNRWDDIIDEDEEVELFCPICGSKRVTFV
jgi:rubrerythrin